jgi:hypothetical protein
MEGFTCQLKELKSLEEWVQGQAKEGVCNPCLVHPIAEAYLGALEEAQDTESIKILKDAHKTSDVLTVVKTLDSIKDRVSGALRNDLLDIDCFAQSYEEQGTVEEVTQ